MKKVFKFSGFFLNLVVLCMFTFSSLTPQVAARQIDSTVTTLQVQSPLAPPVDKALTGKMILEGSLEYLKEAVPDLSEFNFHFTPQSDRFKCSIGLREGEKTIGENGDISFPCSVWDTKEELAQEFMAVISKDRSLKLDEVAVRKKTAPVSVDISSEMKKIKEALALPYEYKSELQREVLFNMALIEIKRKNPGKAEELEDILWEVADLEETSKLPIRIKQIAKGYLRVFCGSKTIKRVMERVETRKTNYFDIDILSDYAKRDNSKRKLVVDLFTENFIRKCRCSDKDLQTVVTMLNDLKAYGAFEDLKKRVEKEIEGKNLSKICEAHFGNCGNDYLLRALTCFGRRGEKAFCEIVQTLSKSGRESICRHKIKGIIGERMKPLTQFELDKMCREKTLTPDKLFKPENRGRNRYSYFHGTMLGLVKTAMETKSGLLGSMDVANFTPSYNTANFWARCYKDGAFQGDDEFGETSSMEKLEDYMSEDTMRLDAATRRSPIILEFIDEDPYGEQTIDLVETNHIFTYPWLSLCTAEGYEIRLSRKSKEEIVRRLGYTEPFDWMDDEWREVVAVNKKKQERDAGPAGGEIHPEGYGKDLTRDEKQEIVRRLGYTEPFDWMDGEWREIIAVYKSMAGEYESAVKSLKQAVEEKNEARFNMSLISLSRIADNGYKAGEEVEDILWDVCRVRPLNTSYEERKKKDYSRRMIEIARGYLRLFGGKKTVDCMIEEINSGNYCFKYERLYELSLIAIARRGVEKERIAKFLADYFLEDVKNSGKSDFSPNFKYIVDFLIDFSSFDSRDVTISDELRETLETIHSLRNTLVTIVSEKGLDDLKYKYFKYYYFLEAISYSDEWGSKFSEIVEALIKGREDDERYLRELYRYLVKPIAGYRCDVSEEEFLKKKGKCNGKIIRHVWRADRKNAYDYYHGTFLGLVKTAIEEKSGLFGAPDGTNITRDINVAERWSNINDRPDDDMQYKTESREALERCMSQSARDMNEKFEPIVLEFEADDEQLSKSDENKGNTIWNNYPSYQWVYLSESEGYGHRLTRRSKEEIVRRLGYTEPFDWMDDEWRDVIEDYRMEIMPEGEPGTEDVAVKEEGKPGIEDLMARIDMPENLSRKLIEAALSILMQKKLVLVFDPNVGRAHRKAADMLMVFKELEKLKKEPKFSALLKDLVIIRDKTATRETVSAAREYAGKKDTEVFIFARVNERDDYRGVEGVSAHGAFIDEGEHAWEAYYYPLAEVVTITLADSLDSGCIEKVRPVLEKLNIEKITEKDGKLIFHLIPRAEAYDVDGSFIDRHKALASFVRAA
ncbi:MAG: hypothetical protein ABH883_00930 [Candidatus Omnitrophota bacterium]